MAQIISTNTASLIAQNNLNKSSTTFTTAISQLSSGKKVSSAADNSAALAISGRMQSQINGNTQAIANANDGIALGQTADSALAQITSNLQQIRTLAVQAANSTNSASDRASLNQQAQQLLAQVNTIATQTQYNGQTLLDGSFGSASFQTGANAGQTSTVNLSQGMKTSQIGQTASASNAITGSGLSGKTLTIQIGTGNNYVVGSAVAGTEAGQSADSAYAAVQAISAANVSGLTATATNTQSFTLNGTAGGALTGVAGDTINLTINGTKVFGDAGYTFSAANPTLSSGDLVNQINSVSGDTGVSAALKTDGTLQLTAADGRDINVTQQNSSTAATPSDNVIDTTVGNGTSLGTSLQGTVSLSASSTITLGGTGAASIDGSVAAGAPGAAAQSASVTGTAATAADYSTTNAAITVTSGGVTKTVSLSTDYTATGKSLTDEATDLQTALNATGTGFGAGAFNVAVTGGKLVISSAATGAASNFSVSADAASATSLGLPTVAATTTNGTDAVTGTPAVQGKDSIGLGSSTLANLDLTSVAGATTALQSLDSALSTVSTLQGNVGALENRFDSTISNLQSTTQNVTSAQSTITDVDYSSVASTLSTADVLQQAGVAMVSKANQIPQQILKLITG